MLTVRFKKTLWGLGLLVGAACMLTGSHAWANPPKGSLPPPATGAKSGGQASHKHFDRPNPAEYRDRLERLGAGKASPAKSGEDRILVLLVEFAGSDTFTFTPGESIWDPYGIADGSESTGTDCDCANIVAAHELTGPQQFMYSGPLHNQIPRPLSADDESATSIWTEDFSQSWYEAFLFGDGVVFNYDRVDGSHVNIDFTGKSVRQYYEDMSNGAYTITGEVIGWLQLPHSTWYYGADSCPGGLSGSMNSDDAPIPEAGGPKDLVRDALDKVNELYPGFNWAQYDLDGDGLIDRLWIVHAGYGEEESSLLGRTDYGEGAVWSHSSAMSPSYEVDPANHIAVSTYIVMPENGGIGVFAHEFAHNLGAIDLYDTEGYGETSAGFWTLMADDWTGNPIGFQPPALDPWHLDSWGWLDPFVVSDPAQVYEVDLGQASAFPGGEDVYRGVRIQLEDGETPHPVAPNGNYEWWGGKMDTANSAMTLITPVALPESPAATLNVNIAWDIEEAWDFLWVQVSTDNGETWDTLVNADSYCVHDASWIGGEYGFPEDLCAEGIGGFTGTNADWPYFANESFDLSAYAGQSILVRFWYMTDWGTSLQGPYLDDVLITAGETTLFADDAEAGTANWEFSDVWERTDATRPFSHSYYLQWRNTGANGGYDSALGMAGFRFAPVNTGLLVWYNNNLYTDNNFMNYLQDAPGFGPKGAMMVVDANPMPYREPYWVDSGYANEAANVWARALMRDAPFSLLDSVAFTMNPPDVSGDAPVSFAGRPAVPLFQDSLGYYPGAEYVRRGPGYDEAVAYKWLTVQWESSVVLPAKDFYGINAPGYTADEELRFDCNPADGGRLSAYWLGPGTGLGYDGGTGNPKDAPSGPAQYGWNVQVIRQTAQGAHVAIWNSLYTANPNFAPKMADIANKTGLEGKLLTFTVSATDPNEADALTYSASNLPAGAAFDPVTATFSWTPGFNAAGVYENVTFTATDNGSPALSDSKSITITVNNFNHAPQLTPIGPRHVWAGRTLTFTMEATDPDNDALTFSAENLPAGAAFDPATATFSWTPSREEAGSYPAVTFVVQDNASQPLSANDTITITVLKTPRMGCIPGSINGPSGANPLSAFYRGDTLLLVGALCLLSISARKRAAIGMKA